MAKKKSSQKTRYRTKTVSRYVGRAKKSMGGLFSGFIAGAGGQIIGKYIGLGAWAQPVADVATGMFMKNETLETIGGRSIGAMLAGGLTGGTTGTTATYGALQ